MFRLTHATFRSNFYKTRTQEAPSIVRIWAIFSRAGPNELKAPRKVLEASWKARRQNVVSTASPRLFRQPRRSVCVKPPVRWPGYRQIEAWKLTRQPQCSSPLLAAPFFLAPLLALFKSGAIAKAITSIAVFLKSGGIVKVISAVSKVSFSVVASLRLMARRILRWWHGEDHIRELRTERRKLGKAGRKPKHFQRTINVLAGVPLFLVVLVFLASMERTPVWGRWRVILMSTDEEAMLVEELLRAGSPSDAKLEDNVPRNWLAILRDALDENASPDGTLLGSQVLDPATDWRAAWVMNVYTRLQDGIHSLNLAEVREERRDDVYDIGGTRYVVPSPKFPLTVRPSALKSHGHSSEENPVGPLLTRYGLLVVDDALCNAASLGFGPARRKGSGENEEAPGVVIVYSGILDAILQGKDCTPTPQPSGLSKAFALFASINDGPARPACPNKHETDQLASVLAHELGHLLLSHSLESLAADNAYELLSSLATDLIRAALYPLTAILGPAFNDWFGEKVRANSALGLKVKSNCESQLAEFEADLLGLRILLGAGIDPRIALDVWGPNGMFARQEQQQAALAAQEDEEGAREDDRERDPFSDSWLERNGFATTHPPNEARYKRILQELKSWEASNMRAQAEHQEERLIAGVFKRLLGGHNS